MANIRFDEIKSWPIPRATLDQQAEIVEEARRSRCEIDRVWTAIGRQVDILTERRQALITAALAGRVGVSMAVKGAARRHGELRNDREPGVDGS
jgi:type I restriction enzyme S subunit